MSSSERVVRPLSLPELTGPAGPLVPGAARQVVREGHRIAAAIIARATAHAGALEAAAQAQGAVAGRRQALEREGLALQIAAAALEAAATRLDAARRDLRRELETGLAAVVIAVAERILGRELAVRPETLPELIREALPGVAPAARITLRLHPDDLACIERHRALLVEVLGETELTLEAAHEVGRGGCVIDTESLTLGAGVPQRLERALGLLTDQA
jgi:flagellar assembly protein FliH